MRNKKIIPTGFINDHDFKTGIVTLFAFSSWTWIIQNIDVKPLGVNHSDIGLATINLWFYRLTGVRFPESDIKILRNNVR